MKIFKKAIKKDLMEILAENYYQCIYYITTTDCGDGQNIKRIGEDVILKDVRIDQEDKLLIHSDNGTYSLHSIDSKSEFLSKCVKNIVEIVNSNQEIDYEELNKRLQDLLYRW